MHAERLREPRKILAGSSPLSDTWGMTSLGRGSRAALWFAGLGIAVLAVVAIIERNSIFERWCIHKLLTGNAEEQDLAIARLVGLKSVKAVFTVLEKASQSTPKVVEVHATSTQASYFYLRDWPGFVDRLQEALVRIGKPGTLELLRGLVRDNLNVRVVSARALKRIWSPAINRRAVTLPVRLEIRQAIPVVEEIMRCTEQPAKIRQAAEEALKKLRGLNT